MRINQYRCRVCGGVITTVDRDPGVTTFYLACRATPDCTGQMMSAMYHCDQTLKPDWEWYKPAGKVPRVFREHVKMGGLLIRKITDEQ